jgi:hypothetical protein
MRAVGKGTETFASNATPKSVLCGYLNGDSQPRGTLPTSFSPSMTCVYVFYHKETLKFKQLFYLH